ncbi:hypothetical protein B0O99DRAFT_623302, partial [Bisporella sp. PMI_857]
MLPSSTWLDLRLLRSPDCNPVLEEHFRPLSSIKDSSYPQIVMFIGKKVKTLYLAEIFSVRNTLDHDKIHLNNVTGYNESQSPILIADCEMHDMSRWKKALARTRLGETEHHSLRWCSIDSNSVPTLVYSQLVLPFSTLACFFASDFGGTRKVASILASWLIVMSNRVSKQPISVNSKILIVVEWDEISTFDEKLATIAFMQQLRQETDKRSSSLMQKSKDPLSDNDFNELLRGQFGDIRVVPLLRIGEGNVGIRSKQVDRLRTRILQESQDVQNLRISARMAFSTQHLKSLFHSACIHFAKDIVTPFEFIKAARIENPIPGDFHLHLATLMKLSKPPFLMVFVAPVIASALALDAYPPNMHSRCTLEVVYNDSRLH